MVIARVVAFVAALGGLAAAQPPASSAAPVRVPLLVVDAPASFDTARFATALATYVPSAELVLVGHPPADAAAICADAQAAARDAHSPLALWVRWADGTLVIERVGEGGCAAIESSTVEVPAEQAAFVYRVAALKVASLVRDVAAPVPPVEPPPPPPRVRVVVPPPPSPRVRRIELGAGAIASAQAAERLYLAEAGAWFGDAWAIGGSVLASAARDEATAGGTGTARSVAVLAGGRRTLTAGAAWALDATAEAGVQLVWSSATRMGGAAAGRERVWTPVVALAPRLRLAVAGPLSVTVGATLELATRSVELALGDTALYHAGIVRLRGDARAEIRF